MSSPWKFSVIPDLEVARCLLSSSTVNLGHYSSNAVFDRQVSLLHSEKLSTRIAHICLGEPVKKKKRISKYIRFNLSPIIDSNLSLPWVHNKRCDVFIFEMNLAYQPVKYGFRWTICRTRKRSLFHTADTS